MAHKPEVRLPYSNLKFAIGKILAKEGYVASVDKTADAKPEMHIALKYVGREPMVRKITRISTPGHRVYSQYEALPRVLSDRGIAIVSTSQGVMTNKEARKRKLGGEVLCEVF